MTVYYMRADGTAANKEAAIGIPTDLSTFMNIATHNTQTFEEGDVVRVLSEGGIYHDMLIADNRVGVSYIGDGPERPIISGGDVRHHAVVMRDSSDLTFQDLVLQDAVQQAFFAAANQGSIRGISLIDLLVRHSNTGAMFFTEDATHSVRDILFRRVEAAHNLLTGLTCALHSGSNIRYEECIGRDNAVNAPAGVQYTAGLYAISLDTNNRLTDVVWDRCIAQGNGVGAVENQVGHGIWFDHAGPRAKVLNSFSSGNQKSGIHIEVPENSPDILVNGNTTCNNETGILLSRGSRRVQLLDNDSCDNDYGLLVTGQWGGGDPFGVLNNTIQGNILANNRIRALQVVYGGENSGIDGRGNQYEDNVLFPQQDDMIEWGWGNTYNSVTEWERAVGRVVGNR